MLCHREFKITLNSIGSSHCSCSSRRLFEDCKIVCEHNISIHFKNSINVTWTPSGKLHECTQANANVRRFLWKKCFKYPDIPVGHVHSKGRGLFWTIMKTAIYFCVATPWSCYAYKLRHVDFSYSSVVSLAILATLFGDLRKWKSTKIKNLFK